jgi:tetratricopeptide (TPR) repeat protein
MVNSDLIIRPGRLAARAIAAATVAAALILTFFAVRWQLGDMFARLTNAADENAVAMADLAVAFAPGDPYASALRSEIGLDPLSGDTRSPVEIAEQTVRLSPADHRWRIALARALVDDGQTERAEAEFRRAIDLAPNFAICRWYYGNFLLRQDRRNEALEQFKVAAADNWDYRQQVFSVLWDIGRKDTRLIESIAGEGVDNDAHLALFFASRGAASDALRVWVRLPPEGKETFRSTADLMAVGLFDQKHFPEALEFSRVNGKDPDARTETVTNGSFESGLESTSGSKFGWRITRGDPKLDIALDNRVAHDGQRSLRLNFKGMAKPDLSNIEQTIAVRSATRYRLTVWIRTENLRSAAPPLIDVLDANAVASIGRSAAFPNGTNDWQPLTIDFATPAECVGITVRTIRSGCSGDDCPVTGLVWYDQVSLIGL